ncbi:Secreted protein [Plasmodiophora brassicae]
MPALWWLIPSLIAVRAALQGQQPYVASLRLQLAEGVIVFPSSSPATFGMGSTFCMQRNATAVSLATLQKVANDSAARGSSLQADLSTMYPDVSRSGTNRFWMAPAPNATDCLAVDVSPSGLTQTSSPCSTLLLMLCYGTIPNYDQK